MSSHTHAVTVVDRPERKPTVTVDITFDAKALWENEVMGVWFNQDGVTLLPSSPSRIAFTPTGLGPVQFNIAVVNVSSLMATPITELTKVFQVVKVRGPSRWSSLSDISFVINP